MDSGNTPLKKFRTPSLLSTAHDGDRGVQWHRRRPPAPARQRALLPHWRLSWPRSWPEDLHAELGAVLLARGGDGSSCRTGSFEHETGREPLETVSRSVCACALCECASDTHSRSVGGTLNSRNKPARPECRSVAAEGSPRQGRRAGGGRRGRRRASQARTSGLRSPTLRPRVKGSSRSHHRQTGVALSPHTDGGARGPCLPHGPVQRRQGRELTAAGGVDQSAGPKRAMCSGPGGAGKETCDEARA